MTSYYLLKAVHVFAAIAWAGSQLVLALMALTHRSAAWSGVEARSALVSAERIVIRALMNPTMIIALGLGMATAAVLGPEYFRSAGWLGTKLVLVLVLAMLHGLLIREHKRFAARVVAGIVRARVQLGATFMVIASIVALAVMKPF